MMPPKFMSGDFFAKFDPELQAYKLYRVLLIEPEFNGIHISIYSNLYPELPKKIDEKALSFGILNLASSGDEVTMNIQVEPGANLSEALSAFADKKNHFGIMHLPLSIAGFESEALHFVGHAPLEAKELVGFTTYLEGMGYTPEDISIYEDHVISISSDRDILNIDKWMKRIVPILALIGLVGLPGTIALIGLIVLAAVSLFWWGRVMVNVKRRYQA